MTNFGVHDFRSAKGLFRGNATVCVRAAFRNSFLPLKFKEETS